MRTYKLTIAYDGTAYQGWQRQANTENTLQELWSKQFRQWQDIQWRLMVQDEQMQVFMRMGRLQQ